MSTERYCLSLPLPYSGVFQRTKEPPQTVIGEQGEWGKIRQNEEKENLERLGAGRLNSVREQGPQQENRQN